MPLMYQEDLQRLRDQPCPCQTRFTPRTLEAYRFMNQAATARDFNPPAIKDGRKPTDKCTNFAVSFFETLESARRRYRQLSKTYDVVAKFGTSIGKVHILPTDGVCEDFRNHHMDLHPYVGTIFHTRVTEYHLAMPGEENAP